MLDHGSRVVTGDRRDDIPGEAELAKASGGSEAKAMRGDAAVLHAGLEAFDTRLFAFLRPAEGIGHDVLEVTDGNGAPPLAG